MCISLVTFYDNFIVHISNNNDDIIPDNRPQNGDEFSRRLLDTQFKLGLLWRV